MTPDAIGCWLNYANALGSRGLQRQLAVKADDQHTYDLADRGAPILIAGMTFKTASVVADRRADIKMLS
jgi:hypothetical protein